MIHATATTRDGTPMVMLGLGDDNITRIRAGDPVAVQLADLGMAPAVVVIFHDDPGGVNLAAIADRAGVIRPAESITPAEDIIGKGRS